MSAATYTPINAIRQALRDRYGASRYRIKRDGEIHVHGQMPNSNTTGWWLFGRINSAETMRDLGIDPAAYQ